ncbi:structural protein [Tanapox virus]|uniref:Structural protein n=2 Tax=Tanapox virus TaxID=99000 RepID=A7XCG5_9POXV|nr:46L protein [Yaba-like disease virus]ABQ43521.1 structural protein [Tanapox virus]ABQ43676.1 structural protein [Tanapox virus]CAC21284.1 46L protein [Yaba-like disease virus]
MALSTREIFSAIGITCMALLMIVSGGALAFKSLAPHRVISMRSVTFNKVITILEYIAILIFVPGTIALYSAYIKTLIVG